MTEINVFLMIQYWKGTSLLIIITIIDIPFLSIVRNKGI